MTSAASVKKGTARCPPGRPRGDANEIPAPGALKRVSASVDGPRARFKGSRPGPLLSVQCLYLEAQGWLLGFGFRGPTSCFVSRAGSWVLRPQALCLRRP